MLSYPLLRFIEHALSRSTPLYADELFGGTGASGEAAPCLIASLGARLALISGGGDVLRPAYGPREIDLAFDASIHASDLSVHSRAIRRQHPRALTWVHTRPPCAEPRTTTVVKTQTEIRAGGARALHACVRMRYSRTSHSTRWLLQTLPIALLEDVKEASCGAAATRFCCCIGDNLQPPGGRIRSERGWRGCGRIAWRQMPDHRGPVAKRTAPAKSTKQAYFGRSTGHKYAKNVLFTHTFCTLSFIVRGTLSILWGTTLSLATFDH
jgi:hypothetical protein